MNTRVEKKEEQAIVEERLSIEVTTRCNFNCSHCFACNGSLKPASLSLSIVKDIITEGCDLGYRHLHITGGEPLLWKHLFPVLDHAYDARYQSVFLNTNGALLASKIAHRLAEYDNLSISVSLEGTRALHEKLRGKNTYDQVVQGIENALNAGLSLSIFTLACRSLLPALFCFAEGLYKNYPGIKCLTLIQPVPVANGSFSLSEELLEPYDLLNYIHMTGALNLLGFATRFLNNTLINAASRMLNFPWVHKSQPLYKEGSVIVRADRDIRLSHSSRHSFGKYVYGGIGAVLVSDEYRRKVSLDEDICPSCKYQEICMESNMERPMEHYWGIESASHFCQEVLDCISTWDHVEVEHLLYSSH